MTFRLENCGPFAFRVLEHITHQRNHTFGLILHRTKIQRFKQIENDTSVVELFFFERTDLGYQIMAFIFQFSNFISVVHFSVVVMIIQRFIQSDSKNSRMVNKIILFKAVSLILKKVSMSFQQFFFFFLKKIFMLKLLTFFPNIKQKVKHCFQLQFRCFFFYLFLHRQRM